MPGGKHDVYILEVDGEYRARPAVVPVEHGNGITFRNLTDYPVTLRFPTDLVRKLPFPGKALGSLQPVWRQRLLAAWNRPYETVSPNSSSATFKFVAGANGAFSYEADVEEPGGPVPVIGESGPKIIVDP